MIELLYFASQIQCGANAEMLNIQVDVYHNEERIQTLSKNEKALLPVNSINELEFQYTITNENPGCSLYDPSHVVLAPGDALPTQDGVFEQESVQTIHENLDEYEELLLVELGTTDKTSAAFDLQDVVIKVNNNPTVALFAD